jgi:hypothetical protein
MSLRGVEADHACKRPDRPLVPPREEPGSPPGRGGGTGQIRPSATRAGAEPNQTTDGAGRRVVPRGSPNQGRFRAM